MNSLGTLLVKHGWLTKHQLDLAISNQRELGGRLGTCLLEMGCISEDLLNRTLSEQQGLPFASAAHLANVPDSVVRLLPAPLAIRYRAVPFKATQSEIDIAMLEVDNLWLQDELSFIVGRPLNIHIANEVRIVEALSRYYGAPRSERFTLLLRHLDRQLATPPKQAEIPPGSRLARATPRLDLEADPGAGAPPQGAADLLREPPPPPAPTAATQTTPSRPASIPLSPQELQALGATPVRPGTNVTRTHPAQIYSRDLGSNSISPSDRDLESFDDASSTEEIGRLLLASLARRLDRVALFQVSSSGVRSWLARGPGLDEQRFRELRISFDRPSIFLNLRAGGSFFLGRLPEMPAHIELASCWNKDLGDECVVFPVRVRKRLVATFYGDRGPLGLAELDLHGVQALADGAARAFERRILEHKKRRGGDADRD